MMNTALYEFDARQRFLTPVLCGVDEAGRGPLAGPVVCAAVILRPDDRFEGLNDSKKVSSHHRERLYDQIIDRCAAHAVAFVEPGVIDEINILQATLRGMAQAIASLSLPADLALIDGNAAPIAKVPCKTVVHGDAESASIAAASILAKVSRDRYMKEMDLRYPGYEFSRHKGYPTALHYARIAELGVSPIHRVTFLSKRENLI